MRNFIILFASLSLFFSCNKEDSKPCGVAAFINMAEYDAATSSKFISIDEEPVITDNCLSVKLSYSGCNGGHEIELIGDGSIGKSLPIVTNFKFNDKNLQLCDAQFFETYEFDLSPLKDFFKGEDEIKIYFNEQEKSVIWKVK